MNREIKEDQEIIKQNEFVRMIGLYNNLLISVKPDDNMAKVILATAELIKTLNQN